MLLVSIHYVPGWKYNLVKWNSKGIKGCPLEMLWCSPGTLGYSCTCLLPLFDDVERIPTAIWLSCYVTSHHTRPWLSSHLPYCAVPLSEVGGAPPSCQHLILWMRIPNNVALALISRILGQIPVNEVGFRQLWEIFHMSHARSSLYIYNGSLTWGLVSASPILLPAGWNSYLGALQIEGGHSTCSYLSLNSRQSSENLPIWESSVGTFPPTVLPKGNFLTLCVFLQWAEDS